MGELRLQRLDLPILSVRVVAEQVAGLSWEAPDLHHRDLIDGTVAERDLLGRLQDDLERYFAGEKVDFNWPLALNGATPFRRDVWRTLCRVPYGETRSYRWVAEQIGQAGAARAVGQANGANRFPLVIPCHRIIASDGSLGGYTGGLDIKRSLLTHEGILK